MLKLPDNLSINAGVNPVDKILHVLAVEKIADPLQELNARATQFVKGQEYAAQVVSKVDDKTYLVKVDNALLKMDLGNAARAGQTMLLRYMQDSPVPTFLMAPSHQKSADNTTQLSPAATLLGQYLKEAENAGASFRIQAGGVVTHTPTNPQIVAQDLKQTITNSGLFYESHLNEVVQGHRQLTSVMQEPQNQSGTHIANLMVQQLATMENQRIAWHGEVWPGQMMDWDTHLQDKPAPEEGRQKAQEDDIRPVSSEITLHLPNLGKVTAKLNIADGSMRIQILAEKMPTLQMLRTEVGSLTQAMADSGLRLEALTVQHHE